MERMKMTDRTRRTSLTLLAATCLLTACELDDGGNRSQEMTIVVEADTQKLQQQEADLAERRAELESQRDQLLQERQTLLQRSGQRSDLAGLIESQKKLLDRERQLRAQEAEIERELPMTYGGVPRMQNVNGNKKHCRRAPRVKELTIRNIDATDRDAA